MGGVGDMGDTDDMGANGAAIWATALTARTPEGKNGPAQRPEDREKFGITLRSLA